MTKTEKQLTLKTVVETIAFERQIERLHEEAKNEAARTEEILERGIKTGMCAALRISKKRITTGRMLSAWLAWYIACAV